VWNYHGPRWRGRKEVEQIGEADTDWGKWLMTKPLRPFDPRIYFEFWLYILETEAPHANKLSGANTPVLASRRSAAQTAVPRSVSTVAEDRQHVELCRSPAFPRALSVL
jgi:hypothetical protein